MTMQITTAIEDGDYDRQYAEITIGRVTIVIYESVVRPGGISVEIDGADGFDPDRVMTWVNDWPMVAAKERLT